ncbi:hypothetical protein [Lyngbya sp. CCY1209]|nr:hypothetical protein [Lyngbya sp. CCY1209]
MMATDSILNGGAIALIDKIQMRSDRTSATVNLGDRLKNNR